MSVAAAANPVTAGIGGFLSQTGNNIILRPLWGENERYSNSASATGQRTADAVSIVGGAHGMWRAASAFHGGRLGTLGAATLVGYSGAYAAAGANNLFFATQDPPAPGNPGQPGHPGHPGDPRQPESGQPRDPRTPRDPFQPGNPKEPREPQVPRDPFQPPKRSHPKQPSPPGQTPPPKGEKPPVTEPPQPAPPKNPEPPVVVPPKIGKPLTLYKVQRGDFLVKIGRQFDVTWQQLYWRNRDQIDNPNLIFRGQVLTIPPRDFQVPPRLR